MYISFEKRLLWTCAHVLSGEIKVYARYVNCRWKELAYRQYMKVAGEWGKKSAVFFISMDKGIMKSRRLNTRYEMIRKEAATCRI
jgi:hypothetical protein